jgi:hypothetical protein
MSQHRLQQAVTGSVNDYTNAVSVGRAPDGERITVYGSGSNVVVLDAHLKRVQIIKRADSGDVVAVAVCGANARIAVLYNNDSMVLYEAGLLHSTTADDDGAGAGAGGAGAGVSAAGADAANDNATAEQSAKKGGHGCPYLWKELEVMPVIGCGGRALSWGPGGERLVVGGARISMWRLKDQINPTASSISTLGIDIDVPESSRFMLAFSRTVATPVERVLFSPDGTMFASLGKRDQLIKMWYARPTEFSGLFPTLEQFDFIYLAHPRPALDLLTSAASARGRR